MKKQIKSGIALLILITSLAACNGSGKGNGKDSSGSDSSTQTHVDTSVKIDTVKKDTAAITADTPQTANQAADTVSKNITKTTVVKKTTTKKQ